MSYFSTMGDLGVASLESRFIQSCGSVAKDFDRVSPSGKQENQVFFIFTIIFLVVVLTTGFLSYGDLKDSKTGKKIVENQKTKDIMKVIFWISLVIFIPLSIMSIYEYIIFLGQWNEWFKKLSPDCQQQYNTMNMISTALTQLSNRSRSSSSN